MAEDAVEVVEQTEEVAIAASESGSKLWKTTWGRFDTFRTFMRRKKGKQLTEEEMEFNRTQSELVRETDVKEVWFAGCHCGEWLLPAASSHPHPALRDARSFYDDERWASEPPPSHLPFHPPCHCQCQTYTHEC